MTRGQDPSSVDSELFTAVKAGDPIEISRLLRLGANPNSLSVEGTPALYKTSDLEIIELLLANGADPNRRSQSGETITHLAAYGSSPELNLLLRYEADPRVVNSDGETPLFCAVRVEQLENIDLLIEFGAHVDHRREDGFTPLHYAVSFGSTSSMKKLISSGASVKTIDNEGRTLLMTAITMDEWTSAVDNLLRDTNRMQKDVYGWSALHLAAWAGNLEAVKQLLVDGLDPYQQTKDGENAIEIARASGHEPLAQILEKLK